jgi:hypothetical protein
MDELLTVEAQFQISNDKEQTACRRHPPDQCVTGESIRGRIILDSWMKAT